MTSNSDFPSFRPFEFTSEKNRATEKSKSRRGYEAAVGRALLAARHYGVSPGVRRVSGLGLKAFHRLLEQAGRTFA